MSRLRPVRVALVVLVVVAATGCGSDDTPDGYSDAVRDGLVQGCAEDDTDPDLVEVCECTYEELADDVSFDDFARIEDRLAQGEERLPQELIEVIRGCIRSVSAERS